MKKGFGLEFAAGGECKVAKLEPGRTAGKCGNIKPGHIIISANASAESSGNYKGAMLQSIKSASKNDVPLEMVFNDPTRKVTGKFTN
jgi:hypothetical protein